MHWIPLRWLRRACNDRAAGPGRQVPDTAAGASPTTPPPVAGDPAPPGPDGRPGVRTLLVPALLSRGYSPWEIAAITQVPLALVHLISEEPGGPALRRTRDPLDHQERQGQPVMERHAIHSRQTEHGSRWRTAAVVLLNAAGTAVSIRWHIPALPFTIMLSGALLGPKPPSNAPRTTARGHP